MRAETVTMTRQWGIGEREPGAGGCRRRLRSPPSWRWAAWPAPPVPASRPRTAPADGGTFTVVVGADPGNLDPHMSVFVTTNFVNSFAYETLVYLGQDGEISSGLAESWEETRRASRTRSRTASRAPTARR